MFHTTTRKAGQWGGRLLHVTVGIGGLAALAMLFAYFVTWEHFHRDLRGQAEPYADRAVRTLVSLQSPVVSPIVKKAAQWFGLCSAYAATTVAEFKTQVMSDPQLTEHYKHFDWDNALIIENSADFHSSVLYKKNEQLYWTRKPLLIKKGERVLTDGKVQVRTYCCNQIALAPPGPFLPPPDEPPPEDIQPPEAPAMPDFPVTPPTIDFPPTLLTFSPPVAPPIVTRRLFIPAPVERPRSFTERPSPRSRIPIPEPGTFILLVSGLGALALSHRRRRK